MSSWNTVFIQIIGVSALPNLDCIVYSSLFYPCLILYTHCHFAILCERSGRLVGLFFDTWEAWILLLLFYLRPSSSLIRDGLGILLMFFFCLLLLLFLQWSSLILKTIFHGEGSSDWFHSVVWAVWNHRCFFFSFSFLDRIKWSSSPLSLPSPPLLLPLTSHSWGLIGVISRTFQTHWLW